VNDDDDLKNRFDGLVTWAIRLTKDRQYMSILFQGNLELCNYIVYFFHPKVLHPTASVVQWSEFLATDPEAQVRFPALPEKKKVVGLERGSLRLVSTTEELLDRKVAAPV
jgi:hypothetical protein